MNESVYIQLGSNLGDREANLGQARDALRLVRGLKISAVSPVYESAAVDMKGNPPPFLNQVLAAECSLQSEELLSELEAIERRMGRDSKGKYRSRTIDLDILLFGEHRISSDRLTVPHPGLTERPFVLVPLLALNPSIRLPGALKPLSQYLTEAGRESVKPYESYVARAV